MADTQVIRDGVSRFNGTAENYAEYRWDYAPAAIDDIFSITGLSTDAAVADIGSGTGMLSRHFVGRVRTIYGVEPNPEMRALAVGLLGDTPSFVSVDGLSHATRLPEHSVDLIVVGRALHWFDAPATRAEFLRILRPDGWLAILQVPCLDLPLLEAIRLVRIEENGWDIRGDKRNRTFESAGYYFGAQDYVERDFPGAVAESWSQFLGRITSISSAPKPSDARYARFSSALARVYRRFSVDGILTVNIATTLQIGQLRG